VTVLCIFAYAHFFSYILMHVYYLLLLTFFFFFNDPATTEIYTLSLHDALPISSRSAASRRYRLRGVTLRSTYTCFRVTVWSVARSEEHTSELQSRSDLVCRLLLEKKKKKK